ncbi:MAG: PEP-CTERM sorting domain-containing protein [Phycisphaeraceae bacterium]
MRNKELITSLFCAAGLTLTGAGVAHAQMAKSILETGDAFSGASGTLTLTDFDSQNLFNINGAGGFALRATDSSGAEPVDFMLASTTGETPSVAAEFGTIGGETVGQFLFAPDLSDSGDVVFIGKNSDTNVDFAFKNNTAIATEGDAIPDFTAAAYRAISRPQISSDGDSVSVRVTTDPPGGAILTDVTSGSTTPVLRWIFGDASNTDSITVDGSNETFTAAFDQDYEVSSDGSQSINIPDISFNPFIDKVLTLSSISGSTVTTEAAEAGGVAIREGTVVPDSAGGDGVSTWDSFLRLAIANDGSYVATGNLETALEDTEQEGTDDDFVLKDGQIVLREGETITAGTVTGDTSGMEMNNDGDWVVLWGVDDGVSEKQALIVNGEAVLTEGDLVEYDGGETALTGIRTGADVLGITDADDAGLFDVYFVGDTAEGTGLFSTTIPEPSTAVIFGLAGLGLLARRRHA